MKAATLGVLSLLTLALGIYIYYGIQKPAEKRETEVPLDERIVPYAIERLEELHLSIPGQKKLVAQSDANGRWRITEPFHDLPSKTKFEGLLNQISQVKQEKLILDKAQFSEDKLEQYKLSGPEALQLDLKFRNEPELFSIYVGGPNPSRTGTYVYLKSQSRVLLASNQLDNLRVETPDEFREKRLLTIDSADFAEVRIKNSFGNIKFQRDTDSKWTMVEPENLPVDQSLVGNQISKLGLLRANEFLTERPKALNKPSIEILVGFKEGVRDQRTDSNDPRPQGSQIFLAREPKKSKVQGDAADQYDYYAVSEKTAPSRISRFHYENFNKSYKDFVKKTFDDFGTSQIQEIRVENKGDNFSLKASGDSFVWDEAKPVVKETLESALSQLRNLVAQEFLGLEAAGSKVDLRLRLKLKSGEEKTYSFRSGSKENLWWLSQGGQTLKYSLRPGSFNPSVWTKASLQSPVKPDENTEEPTKDEQRN